MTGPDLFFLKMDRAAALRGLALLSGALALALYCWGLLNVLGAVLEAEDGGADSAPVRPCRTAGNAAGDGAEVVDYSVRYVPLRFVCETRGGGTYATDDVPGYVNPGAFGFGLAGVLFGIGAGYEAELRARRAAAPGATPADEAPGPRS